MGKPRQTYKAYDNGTYIGRGTDKEIAALTGLLPSTVRNYGTRSKGTRWYIECEVTYYAKDQVDMERLQAMKAKGEYTYPELAEHIGVSAGVMWRKFYRYSRWSRREIEVMEDLFFLDDGELLLYTTDDKTKEDAHARI